jgi:glutamine synthetase
MGDAATNHQAGSAGHAGLAAASFEGISVAVGAGTIDTVIVALTDMQGRLQGKRLHAPFFVDQVIRHGTETCSYLLAVDIDMNTVDGYDLTSWDRGYGDFELIPDPATVRILPWQERTALVLADVQWPDGTAVAPSPRQMLKGQLARAAGHGWTCYSATELEFIVFEDSYEKAWDLGYRGLTPANRYNVDYSVLGTSRVEPLLRDLRLGMAGAGMTVESAKGECNPGQHEIAFLYRDALTTCDQHVVYKTGAKEIAAAHGCSLTFMAKPNDKEGNSCHIHMSFRDGDGRPVMAGDGPYGLSETGGQMIAGLLAGMRELTLLFAPNVNSYKRFQDGSFAPTTVAWGPDNRTCALRLVGHGPSLRVECRVPGGDVNPYLAMSGLVAAALTGVEQAMPLPPPVTGNAYAAGGPRVPGTLDEAAVLWSDSVLAAEAFGPDVVAHYANMARVELDSYHAAVTDWELRRCFERL